MKRLSTVGLLGMALVAWYVARGAAGCGTARASGAETTVECKEGTAVLKASGSKEELVASWRAYGYEAERTPATVAQVPIEAIDGQLTVHCTQVAPSVSRVVFVSPSP